MNELHRNTLFARCCPPNPDLNVERSAINQKARATCLLRHVVNEIELSDDCEAPYECQHHLNRQIHYVPPFSVCLRADMAVRCNENKVPPLLPALPAQCVAELDDRGVIGRPNELSRSLVTRIHAAA